MQERLDKLAAQEKKERASTVTLEARYQPVHQLQAGAAVADRDGRGGRVGPGVGQLQQRQEDRRRRQGRRKKDAAPAEEKPKKKGFGLGGLASSLGGGEKKSGQTVASGGARGLDPEVDAKGGPNPGVVSVSVTRADIEAFRKDGKLA